MSDVAVDTEAALERLPDEVRAVLEQRERTGIISGLEFRDASGTGDGSFTLSGVPIVYGTRTVLYSGKFFTLTEEIAEGAARSALQRNLDEPLENIHLNHGHDMMSAIARHVTSDPSRVVRRGELALTDLGDGVHAFARLNENDPDVRALAEKMKRDEGSVPVVDQMSFKFRIGREELNVVEDHENEHTTYNYTVTDIARMFDVCVCAQGAFPTTSAALRDALSAGGRDLAGLGRALPDHGAATPGSDDDVAARGVEEAHRRERLKLRARAAVASLTT